MEWIKAIPAPNPKKDLNTDKKRTQEKHFSDINCTNVFLGESHKAIEIKTKINKWDQVKLTGFCTAKEIINKMKRQPSEWKKTFANNVTDKSLVFNIYKQLLQLNNNKKQTT